MDAESGNCFPRQETIAADVDVTDRTVRNALANLRACDWLEIEERALPKGRGKSNFYRFRDATTGTRVPVIDATTGTTNPVNDTTTGNLAQDFRKTASGASIDEHVGRNTLNRESTKRAPRAHPLPEDFKPDLRVAHAAGMEQAEAQRQAALFLDHYRGNGKPMRDWNAAWRNWIRRVPDFASRPNGPDRQQGRPPHIADQAYEDARQAFVREHQGGLSDDGVEPADDPAGYLPPGVRQ
nr:helix-turn-helix domain-containing protein [Rhizobium sp. SEMIA 4085]